MSATRGNARVLRDVALCIGNTEHLALVGESEKIWLAQAIAGKLFYSGQIDFIKNGNTFKPNIAYVPQKASIKNLSNLDDFYYQQRFNSTDAADAKKLLPYLLEFGTEKDVLHWAAQLAVTHRLQTPLLQLSNGELKKSQLITYLLAKPDLLILENAFTGLDGASRATMEGIINQLAQGGMKIIAVDIPEALPACITHIAVVQHGTVTAHAPKSKIATANIPPTAAVFSGGMPPLQKIIHAAPLVQMNKVTIRYGSTVILNNITWQVNSGDCWWIKGHNGAGKSTLLSLINGDNPQAYSQDIKLFGRQRGSGESIWDIKKNIGYISPELANCFDRSATVFDTVASGLFDTIGLFKKLSKAQAATITAWLQYFNLHTMAQQLLCHTAPGIQRLALLARALAKGPLLLALDEPYQGMEPEQVQHINNLLERLHRQTNVSILFIDHYEWHVPRCISKVLTLEKGEAAMSTYEQPQDFLEKDKTIAG